VTTTEGQPRILVGVSGSTASLRALRWAAHEAVRRGARLEIVLAWQPEQPAYYAVEVSHADHRQQHDAAERLLAASLRSVADAELPDSLTADVIEGLAERVLPERSGGAAMLVLGSTSSPTPYGRSIGPVIRSCLCRAACTVVIVGPELGPEQGTGDYEPPSGRHSRADVDGLLLVTGRELAPQVPACH
jgi:nucleotide-binding universal stress UspA family protein